MSYVLPSVNVFQEFTTSPTAQQNPLRAHISGPHAQLIRFDDADEKPLGNLGVYDRLSDTAYTWPNREAGAKVDVSYVKLYAENAILRYFEDTVAGGSDITKVSGYNNRVRSNSVNFKTNGGYAHDASLLDRGAKVGDVIKVRLVPGGGDDPVTVWSTIADFVGDTIDDVIASATEDSANEATQPLSESATQVAGVDNGVDITDGNVDASAYDGLADGYITETYTVLVTQASSGGDLTTAKIRVTSASGLDDEDDVTPAAAGAAFDIGSRGAKITFDQDATAQESDSADAAGVSAIDLIVGQKWEVDVAQAFSAVTATEGGDYTGASDTTYVIEVTRGGNTAASADADKPQITVTTTTGVDASGPTTVDDHTSATAVGTKGVTVTFSTGELRKGDKFYIEVDAETEGPMRTIVLNHNMPSDIAAGTPADVELFILKPTLQIEANRLHAPPETNWSTSETQITVDSGITVLEETWTDNSEPQALPLYSDSTNEYSDLFVEYRAWRADLCNAVYAIDDTGDLDSMIEGPLDPDNPLKWGVFKALSNSNGVEVKFTAVCDPDDATSWNAVLELLVGRDDVYTLAPLTRDRTVLDLYHAHVTAQSQAEVGQWRGLFVNLEGIPEIPLVHAGSTVTGHTAATTSDDNEALAVIEDDPDTTGTQYTIVRVPAGNADFISNGVQAGDIVRAKYTSDGFGNSSYSEYVVDAVQTEDQLRLVAGPDSGVSQAAKIEVWRTLDATEEAAEIAADAGSWGDRRVKPVWPDQIESSGTVQEGYFLCAALAGELSGVLPHRSLTNTEVAGFSDVPRTTDKFNKTQLDTLAEAGTWIVTKDIFNGQVYTRHAVTSGDTDDLNQREEVITRNVDSISYRFKDTLAPFIGISNVTDSLLEVLHLEITDLVEVLKTENFTTQLGGQLNDATIVRLEQHATLKDRVVIVLDADTPPPFNNADVKLVI